MAKHRTCPAAPTDTHPGPHMSFSFPPEIEDEIFTWVVRMRPYYRTDASLPCVSKRVQACIEPILYETVKLHGDYNMLLGWTAHEKDFAVVLDRRSPSFFEMHVKNLGLMGTVSNEHMARVLSICTGVRNLAVWRSSFDISPIVKLQLHSLDTSIPIICDLSKLHQTFPELVYLSVRCQRNEGIMPSLEWLPALTHVRLEVGRYNDLVPAIIRVISQTSRSLRSILIQITDSHEWEYDRAQLEAWAGEDSRVTIKEKSSGYYQWHDWEERVACDSI